MFKSIFEPRAQTASRSSAVRAYGAAVAAVALATLIRVALDPWVGDHAPFMVFAFAVVAAAQAGGFRAGVTATILGIAISDYLLVPPRHTFFLHDPRGDLIMLIIFAALGVALSLIGERLNRAKEQVRTAMLRLKDTNNLLESERRELQIANERFRMATEVANEAIWEWNLEARTIACTDSYTARFGRPDTPYDRWWFDHIHAEDRENVGNSFSAATEGTADRWVCEYRMLRADGCWANVYDRVLIARRADGKPSRIIGAILDVTEAKRVQEELERRTRELSRSNEDLQRFAYAASHDLQAPLRMIGNYNQRLANMDSNAESEPLIRGIADGIRRMQTLIQDLLEFARVGSGPARPAIRCDCNALLDLALQYLRGRITETDAKISSDPLPIVMANDARLLRVFQNLIGNALQYCHGQPEIHVSAQREDDDWVVSISDNGIGIAPEYHDQIFGLFKRLHSYDEYSGSGMGLAIVKRIIESFGGRVWVDSQPGRGSTFYFSLPSVEVAAVIQHRA